MNALCAALEHELRFIPLRGRKAWLRHRIDSLGDGRLAELTADLRLTLIEALEGVGFTFAGDRARCRRLAQSMELPAETRDWLRAGEAKSVALLKADTLVAGAAEAWGKLNEEERRQVLARAARLQARAFGLPAPAVTLMADGAATAPALPAARARHLAGQALRTGGQGEIRLNVLSPEGFGDFHRALRTVLRLGVACRQMELAEQQRYGALGAGDPRAAAGFYYGLARRPGIFVPGHDAQPILRDASDEAERVGRKVAPGWVEARIARKAPAP